VANSTPVDFVIPPDTAVGIAAAPPTVAPGNFNLNFQSYVELNDGTVGAVLSYFGGSPGSRTARVYWATAASPAALFAPASVSLGPVLIEQSSFSHALMQASVNRGPDGALYASLFTMRSNTLIAGLFPLPPDKGTYIYRSADEGASWTFHGTVQNSGTGIGGGSFGGYGDLGEIYYSDSGRWILPFGIIQNYFGATRGVANIAYSDDLGVTWTWTASHGAFYISGSSRQIAYNTVDGNLYYCSRRSQNPNYEWRVSSDDGASWVVFQSANFFSGDPFLNHEMTGIASPTGFTWFAGQNGTRASAHAVLIPVPTSADPVLLETWEGFNAGPSAMGMQPVGGGLWAFMDATEIIQFEENDPGDPCLVTAEVQCCCDAPPGEEIPDCECPCIEILLTNLSAGTVDWTVTNPLTAEVCMGSIAAGGPTIEVHLCGPFANGEYVIDVNCAAA